MKIMISNAVPNIQDDDAEDDTAADDRGRAKVRVLTEISLIFLSQTDTFNASSSLKKNCNKFMY